MSRGELATEKGIDHDYNYLTSLERAIDRADRDCSARGICIDEAGLSNQAAKGHVPKGEVPLKAALERCRVQVIKAPVGMSRAKTNQTRWAKKRHQVVWTVEWVHPDGRKELGECAENSPIEEVYAQAYGPKQEYQPRKKRRMMKQQQQHEQEESAKTSSSLLPPSPGTAQGDDAQALQSEAEQKPDKPSNQEMDRAEQSSASQQQEPPTNPSPWTFHLHAPLHPSKHPVLIPIPTTTTTPKTNTLSTLLPNRLLLEYPTIYVFHHPKGYKGGSGEETPLLPAGFISEEDFYRRQHRVSARSRLPAADGNGWRERARIVEEVCEEGEIPGGDDYGMNGENEDEGRGGEGRKFDAQRVLEVLGRDLDTLN